MCLLFLTMSPLHSSSLVNKLSWSFPKNPVFFFFFDIYFIFMESNYIFQNRGKLVRKLVFYF